MPKVLLYILLFSFSIHLYSEEDTSSIDSVEIIYLDTSDIVIDSAMTVMYDSTEVEVLPIPKVKIDSLRASGDYIYLTAEEREKLGLWDWLKMKFLQWYYNLFNSLGEFGLIELIVYIFGAIILGFIIYKIANHGLSFGFVSSGEQRSEGDLVVSIKKDEFDKLIETARSSGNRNEIIRLSFLRIISDLNNKNIIKYTEDKTNRDYYYEISDENIKSQFKKVSNIFDFTFYGEFEISESHLSQFEPLFQKLHNSLLNGASK
jgi:hypothetical protein